LNASLLGQCIFAYGINEAVREDNVFNVSYAWL